MVQTHDRTVLCTTYEFMKINMGLMTINVHPSFSQQSIFIGLCTTHAKLHNATCKEKCAQTKIRLKLHTQCT